MHRLLKRLICFTFVFGMSIAHALTDNQTDTLSTVVTGAQPPFQVTLEQANFQLPVGLHSGVVGIYNGMWVFIAGRTNGLHGFSGPNPFPVAAQNTTIYVVNPSTGVTTSRSLTDSGSGLSQQQLDTLSVTSPQWYQDGNTVYISGGYGIDTATGTFSTKPVLTAIFLPGIVKWVMQPNNKGNTVAKNIKQIYNPIFQIAGGEMLQLGNITQLIFGQNFTGVYTTNSNGDYSQQVRRFRITNKEGDFHVNILNSLPNNPDPNYRRRDLNILPAILNVNNKPSLNLIAYAGVFTPGAGGVWTVPVVMDSNGNPTMADPNLPNTFKQAMNHYVTASAGFYSAKNKAMYHVFFGGMSFGYYSSGVFTTDTEIPFINQITTVLIDKNGNYTQFLMPNQYPTILSTTVNPGNQLLFGSGAYFIAANALQKPGSMTSVPNGIFALDNITKPTMVGYIIGGIASTVPNTVTDNDSFGSTYIFKVIVTPSA